jgi:hypothetical protein
MCNPPIKCAGPIYCAKPQTTKNHNIYKEKLPIYLMATFRTLKLPKNGVSFAEALRLAREQKRIIPSNKFLDQFLTKGPLEGGVNLSFHSGTMSAYVKPDEPFKAEVKYTDKKTGHEWIFPVPSPFQNEKNAILVAEHPNYAVEVEGNKCIIHVEKNNIILVKNFGRENGWYVCDEATGIPTGKGKDFWEEGNGSQRYLHREEAHIGPVDRAYNSFYTYPGQDIFLNKPPSSEFVVLVEDIQKGEAEEQRAGEPPPQTHLTVLVEGIQEEPTPAGTEQAEAVTEQATVATPPVEETKKEGAENIGEPPPTEEETRTGDEQPPSSTENLIEQAIAKLKIANGIKIYMEVAKFPPPAKPKETKEENNAEAQLEGKN